MMNTQLTYKAVTTGANLLICRAGLYACRVARSKYTTIEMNRVNEAKFKHIPVRRTSMPIFVVDASLLDAMLDPEA